MYPCFYIKVLLAFLSVPNILGPRFVVVVVRVFFFFFFFFNNIIILHCINLYFDSVHGVNTCVTLLSIVISHGNVLSN